MGVGGWCLGWGQRDANRSVCFGSRCGPTYARAQRYKTTPTKPLTLGRSGPNLKPGTVCVCGMNGLRIDMNPPKLIPNYNRDPPSFPPSPLPHPALSLSLPVVGGPSEPTHINEGLQLTPHLHHKHNKKPSPDNNNNPSHPIPYPVPPSLLIGGPPEPTHINEGLQLTPHLDHKKRNEPKLQP